MTRVTNYIGFWSNLCALYHKDFPIIAFIPWFSRLNVEIVNVGFPILSEVSNFNLSVERGRRNA